MNERGTYDHPFFGIVSPENGWVPAPSYVLRRHRVLSLLREMPRGKLLEVGCGAGALLVDLSALGFTCSALESAPSAASIADRVCGDRTGISIRRTPDPAWDSEFDYVAAFEVLEHIEDDAAAVREWFRWLRPGGRLVISVPGHPERWNASDRWAGHFRRYTRASLGAVLRQAGFEVGQFQSYGFPLANIIEPIRAIHHARQLRTPVPVDTDEKAHGSARSGVERTLEGRLFPLQASPLGVLIMRTFCGVQDLVRGTELGTGHLVVAEKRSKS